MLGNEALTAGKWIDMLTHSQQKVYELIKNMQCDHRPKVLKLSALPTVHWTAVVNGCLD